MYLKDPTLRGPGEKVNMTQKRIEEFIRCKEDILYFAEKYFTIVSIDKGKHKIKLREYQKRILKAFVEPPNEDKKHVAMLASRQIGKSTVSTIYITHYVLFEEDKKVAILANNEKTAKEILRRIKLAIKSIPIWMQQGISEENGGWNKNTIGFENGNIIMAGSTASTAFRGESVALLYMDEFAHVPDNIADEFMDSVYPTISSSEKAKMIVVSTPKGMNHFYHIWRGAIEKDPDKTTDFFPIKINWNEIEGRDKKWKEKIINNKGIQHFLQEYACKFLGSSNTLIDPEILERITPIDPIELKLGHNLHIFERPIEGEMYMLGVDSAKGTGKDYSVIQVLKISHEHEIKQVATYRFNYVETQDFAEICISVSEFYNGAYMMIENNDVGGEVAKLIWYQYEYDKILNCDKKGIGIRSTRASKLSANVLLKRYVDNGWLEITERNTLYELSRYEEVRPDVFKAPRGSNDDCVTSLLWGLYFLSTIFFDGKKGNVKVIDPKFKISIEDKNDDSPIFFDNDGNSVNDAGFDDVPEGWGYEQDGSEEFFV